jgi:hypothetical protein
MKKIAAGFPDDPDDKRPLTDEEMELILALGDDSLAEVARQIASEDEEK